jgi:tRNA(Arg) A34 adenosine deaminase TadA
VSDPETFMRRAIALSLESVQRGTGGPFGAVITSGGRVVAEGSNAVTSALDPTAHAEIVAIRAACARLGRFELSGCELYTSCEPCPMCLGAIYWARLDRVWFGNDRADAARIRFDDAAIYGELALAPAARKIPFARLLPEEARTAFEAWERKPDKVRY